MPPSQKAPKFIYDIDSGKNVSADTSYHMDMNYYETFLDQYGLNILLPKGTKELDVTIRKSNPGIWINSEFYFKKK